MPPPKAKRPTAAQFEALRRLHAMGGEVGYLEWRNSGPPWIRFSTALLVLQQAWIAMDDPRFVSLTDTGKAVVLRGDYVGLRGRKGL